MDIDIDGKCSIKLNAKLITVSDENKCSQYFFKEA